MSVIYYGRGDHPGGFIGYRVSRTPVEDFKQTYFSTAHLGDQSDNNLKFKRIRLQAELYDASWAAASALKQYQQFVTLNHPGTAPERGVGVHGITASFIKDRAGKWGACFLVSIPASENLSRKTQEYSFHDHLYSVAWRNAVETWADVYEILQEDRVRVLNSMPEPEKFKHLRRMLNEKKGCDIPIEALAPVYHEQRAQLAEERRLRASSSKSSGPVEVPVPAKELQTEMTAWFEKELRQSN